MKYDPTTKIHFELILSLLNILNSYLDFVVENFDILDKRGPHSKNWWSWYKKKWRKCFFLNGKRLCILGLVEIVFFFSELKKKHLKSIKYDFQITPFKYKYNPFPELRKKVLKICLPSPTLFVELLI